MKFNSDKNACRGQIQSGRQLWQFWWQILLTLSLSVFCSSVGTAAPLTSATAGPIPISIAGFAFEGAHASAAARFPYSYKIYDRLHLNAQQSLSKQVADRAMSIQNPALELQAMDKGVNLKNSDQALMAVLVLSNEIVSTQVFGTYYKTFVNLRGNALIFDYKSKAVVRSYPLNVVLFDAKDHAPTDSEISEYVESLISRQQGKDLLSQFVKRLSSATLPQVGGHTVQVRKAEVAPEALAVMPESLRQDPSSVESMIVDTFASILSDKMGVSVLPSKIGHAIGGTMVFRLENGDDQILKLGEGDYLFDLKISKFAKIKNAETNVGASYVYGAYGNMHFFEPLLNTDFINTDLKNGEVAVVPAGELYRDDFPAYQDAIRGMFTKLADTITQPNAQSNSAWITKAASAKDISTQLQTAREKLGTCK
jgi:hypothetical protein